jgi:hypothetical protein
VPFSVSGSGRSAASTGRGRGGTACAPR